MSGRRDVVRVAAPAAPVDRLRAVLAAGLQSTSCGTGGFQTSTPRDTIRIAAILVGSTVRKGPNDAHVKAVGKLYNNAVRFLNNAISTDRQFKPQNISVDGTNYRITVKETRGRAQGELDFAYIMITASVRGAASVNVMWLPVGAREGSWKRFPALSRYEGPWQLA